MKIRFTEDMKYYVIDLEEIRCDDVHSYLVQSQVFWRAVTFHINKPSASL